MLADLLIGDRLVRKADGGRRPKAIPKIPVNHKGTVGLVDPSPDPFHLVSRFQLPKGGNGGVCAHPVVCGLGLYPRHDETLFCYDASAG